MAGATSEDHTISRSESRYFQGRAGRGILTECPVSCPMSDRIVSYRSHRRDVSDRRLIPHPRRSRPLWDKQTIVGLFGMAVILAASGKHRTRWPGSVFHEIGVKFGRFHGRLPEFTSLGSENGKNRRKMCQKCWNRLGSTAKIGSKWFELVISAQKSGLAAAKHLNRLRKRDRPRPPGVSKWDGRGSD